VLGSIIYVPASLVHPFNTESFQAMLFLHNLIDAVTVKDSIVAFHPDNSAFAAIRPLLSTGAANASTVAFENVTTLGGLANLIGRNQTNANLVASTSRSLTGGIPSVFTGNSNPWSGMTGAQVCKRYENGVLTEMPLWPWPMNDRIKAATAAAGAYRGPCSFSCVGGRPVRPAIDVTEEIESFLGPIPPQCKSE
jgi:hypothetical protein